MKKLTLIVAMAAFVGSFSVMASSDLSAVSVEMNGDHDQEKCKKKDCKKCKDKKACATKKGTKGKSCNSAKGKSCCSKKK